MLLWVGHFCLISVLIEIVVWESQEDAPRSCIAVLDPLGSYHNRAVIVRSLRTCAFSIDCATASFVNY